MILNQKFFFLNLKKKVLLKIEKHLLNLLNKNENNNFKVNINI
jgi:hypothetical protein